MQKRTYAHCLTDTFPRPSVTSESLKTIFPSGAIVDHMVSSADVRSFCSHVVDRNDITCFRCGENGHRKNECMQWRTRLCWHFTNSRCYKECCPFAHGREQLREPWTLRCIRIVKIGSAFHDIGCGSIHHSFRSCPKLSHVDPVLALPESLRDMCLNDPSAEPCMPCQASQ